MRRTHNPEASTWNVGDVVVHRVDEITLPPETGPWLLPEATRQVVEGETWLAPDFADDQGVLRLSSHSFALMVDGMRILVDTGIGNGKPRANPAWHDLDTGYLDRLHRAGFPPESVDLVILTHLHTDHVGWNTRADGTTWVPTFPNARYLATKTEWDFWAGYDMDEPRRQMFRDSVQPIREAGLLNLVDVQDRAADVAPGLRLLPTPGHTPGHVAVEVRSRTETALITGDCVHHPVQMPYPGIGSCVDIDPVRAEATRRSLLASLADTGILVLGTHFPPPTAGHVQSYGDAHRLVPVPQSSSLPRGGERSDHDCADA